MFVAKWKTKMDGKVISVYIGTECPLCIRILFDSSSVICLDHFGIWANPSGVAGKTTPYHGQLYNKLKIIRQLSIQTPTNTML